MGLRSHGNRPARNPGWCLLLAPAISMRSRDLHTKCSAALTLLRGDVRKGKGRCTTITQTTDAYLPIHNPLSWFVNREPAVRGCQLLIAPPFILLKLLGKAVLWLRELRTTRTLESVTLCALVAASGSSNGGEGSSELDQGV
jgi:hypothetical protein